MKASEKAIIQQYLAGSYCALQDARRQNKENQSERFPMVSKELACSQREFDILCGLAKDLGISYPWRNMGLEDDTNESKI